MTWYVEHAAFLDHWDDLISDFSAIHHVRVPLERLSACWLWPMAERLAAYTGVLRARADSNQDGQPSRPQSGGSRRPSAASPNSRVDSKGRHVNPVQEWRPDDPLLKGFVETNHKPPAQQRGA